MRKSGVERGFRGNQRNHIFSMEKIGERNIPGLLGLVLLPNLNPSSTLSSSERPCATMRSEGLVASVFEGLLSVREGEVVFLCAGGVTGGREGLGLFDVSSAGWYEYWSMSIDWSSISKKFDEVVVVVVVEVAGDFFATLPSFPFLPGEVGFVTGEVGLVFGEVGFVFFGSFSLSAASIILDLSFCGVLSRFSKVRELK